MNMKLTKGIVLLGLGVGVILLVAVQGRSLLSVRELAPLTASAEDGPGNSMVDQAAEGLAQSPPFEAELRQESRLYGVAISAPGRYLQQGQGSGKFRLELKTSFNEHVATLLRVSDGRFLYTRISLPDSTTLTRLDLASIEQTLTERVPVATSADPSAEDSWMFAGLPFLLRQLRLDFAFAEPVESHLGEMPVWKLTGTWKLDALQRFYLMRTGQPLPANYDLRNALPKQFPTAIELVLGRGGNLDLFPIQVRYLRDDLQNDQPIRGTDPHVLASIEFQRVVFNVSLDEVVFNYDAGDEEVEYRTAEFQQTLQARFPHVLPADDEDKASATELR